jgi:hypothetical protein
MSTMFLDIINSIVASQADIDVVRTGRSQAELLDAGGMGDADVVILANDSGADGATKYNDLLYSRGRLKVIEITGDGRHGSLYELRPHRVPLGEMSPFALLDAIRASASP